jgi:hypothetical protein
LKEADFLTLNTVWDLNEEFSYLTMSR